MSALAHYDLTDTVPDALDVALPRGARRPATQAAIRWHLFDATTFDLGRQKIPVPGLGAALSIGIYSAERCIADAFRLRGSLGYELGARRPARVAAPWRQARRPDAARQPTPPGQATPAGRPAGVDMTTGETVFPLPPAARPCTRGRDRPGQALGRADRGLLDNAMAESFFATLRNELIYRHPGRPRPGPRARSSPGSRAATTGADGTRRSAWCPRSSSRPQHDTLPPKQRDPCPPRGVRSQPPWTRGATAPLTSARPPGGESR